MQLKIHYTKDVLKQAKGMELTNNPNTRVVATDVGILCPLGLDTSVTWEGLIGQLIFIKGGVLIYYLTRTNS